MLGVIRDAVLGLAMLLLALPACAQSAREIEAVQARLAELGYEPGPADGMMGSMTENAILAFQHDMGMEETGTVSVTLMHVLGANPDAPVPLEEVQARLVDIIGERWERRAVPLPPSPWEAPPREAMPAFADYPALDLARIALAQVDLDSHPESGPFADALLAAVGEPGGFCRPLSHRARGLRHHLRGRAGH